MNVPLSQIEVITLFVNDVAKSREFYDQVFARPVVYEDDVSFVLEFESLMVNVLQIEQAHELVEPRSVSTPSTSPQMLLTIRVEDADAACTALRDNGAQLLNGPTDRPWGRRTAAFADPSGHVWEIAQVIADQEGAA